MDRSFPKLRGRLKSKITATDNTSPLEGRVFASGSIFINPDSLTCSGGFPLLAEEFGCGDEGTAALTFEAAFKGDHVLVADELEAFEAVHVIVAHVFAGHFPSFAAGDVNVAKILAPGNKGGHIAGFLPRHVPEITHHADAGMIDVPANSGAVGHLAQEMAFAPIERFEQEVEAGFLGVIAQFGQALDEELAGFPVAELGLIGAGRHHDYPGGTQGAGSG